MQSLLRAAQSSQMVEKLRAYGSAGVYTHLGLGFFVWYPACFLMVKQGVDASSLFRSSAKAGGASADSAQALPLDSKDGKVEVLDSISEEIPTVESLALTFALYKAISPVRYFMTLGLTPFTHRAVVALGLQAVRSRASLRVTAQLLPLRLLQADELTQLFGHLWRRVDYRNNGGNIIIESDEMLKSAEEEGRRTSKVQISNIQ
eukprot:g32964.t1